MRLSEEQRENFEQEVHQFIKANCYHHSFNGLTQFILFGLAYDNDGHATLNLRAPNSIETRDKRWESGLARIGRKYSLNVKLPAEMYTRPKQKPIYTDISSILNA